MKIKLLLIILLLTGLQTYAGEGTTTIILNSCDQDARMDNTLPNANWGNAIEYYSGAWTISGSNSIQRNFFKFNLSCIPTNAIIQSASLSLFWADSNAWGNMQHSNLSNSNESVLQRITSSWNASTVTWNTQPSVTTTDQVILPQSTSPTQDYTNMDVTAMVQQMVSSTNYGFSLRLTNEIPYAALLFASSNNPHVNKHPALTITYTTPATACLHFQLTNCIDDDARMDNTLPNSNWGNALEYYSGAWTISGSNSVQRNFFRFNNVSCIPANATILSASLSLFWADTNGWGNMQHSNLSNSNESVLQRVTSSWVESTVTWNTQPSVTAADQVILPQSTSPTQDYTNLDVTAMVQQMVSTTNYGFSLRLTNEVPYATLLFASSNNPHANKHPTLDICYSLPDAVNEIIQKNNISIYPNPAANRFTIAFTNPLRNTSLKIFNLIGEEVYAQTVNGKEETVNSKLPSGIYFVEVRDEERLWVEKVVVE